MNTPQLAAGIAFILLPDMYGADLIKYLRGDKHYQDTPIIVQTGITDPEELDKLIKLGANSYINKPFSKELLGACIKKLLAI